MSDESANLNPVAELDVFRGSATTIEIDENTTKTFFSNNRSLLMRAFSGHTINGFIARLIDEGHPSKPICFFKNSIDDEDRISLEVQLEFLNIPKEARWGRVSSTLLMRAYHPVVPEWRRGTYGHLEPHQRAMDIDDRDKLGMSSNLSCFVPDTKIKPYSSFLMRSSIPREVEIPDNIWSPCFEFCTAAGNAMKNGEFPDFSVLNKLHPHTETVFETTENVLSYSGPLKPSDSAPRNG